MIGNTITPPESTIKDERDTAVEETVAPTDEDEETVEDGVDSDFRDYGSGD